MTSYTYSAHSNGNVTSIEGEGAAWYIVTRAPDGSETWRSWSLPSEVNARLVAYSYVAKVPVGRRSLYSGRYSK